MDFRVDEREGLVLKFVYVVQILQNGNWVDVGTDSTGSTKTSILFPTYEEAVDHMNHLIKITAKNNIPKTTTPAKKSLLSRLFSFFK